MRADLHFHLLPGVDDGPQTMDESLELARMAVADGTSIVVATPHASRVDLDELPERVAEVQARIDEASIPIDVRCGAELAWRDVAAATDEQLATVAHGPADARWVLLEAPLPDAGATAADFAASAAEVRGRGYDVLVAHPERVAMLFEDDAAALHEQLDAGALLQLNASSVIGAHDPADRERGLALVHAGLATVLASDAHRRSRGPALSAGLQALLDAGVPAAAARDLVDRAPRALLEHGLPARRRGDGRAAA